VPSFADLGVPHDLDRALHGHGIETPTPIQALTVADGLAGRDVSGKAETGSGKTLAFGIPLVAGIDRAGPGRPTALVLVPTRELARQVADELTWLGRPRKRRVFAVYGGAGFGPQLQALRRGTDVLVACPGRLQDLIGRGAVDLDAVQTVVIDEADRMADMGFLPEVRKLLDRTPPNRQTLLFSATLDGAVDTLVRAYQSDPVRHEVADDPSARGRMTHHFWRTERDDRVAVLAEVLAAAGPTIVFCRTKYGTESLAKKLGRLGVRTETLHGNRSQGQRERALEAFASGRVPALLATDVAARGIHVDGVACVVHFDPPADEKDYLHRSGRTARAGASGTVVTFVTPDLDKAVRRLQRTLDRPEAITPPDVGALGLEPVLVVAAPRVEATAAEPAPPQSRERGRQRARERGSESEPASDRARARTTSRSAARARGTLKFFDTKRGFGFIDQGTGTDLFVHHSGLDVAGHRLREGATVEFEIGDGRRGAEARNVRLVAV
jgi:superfamily II DNA/RNA helicase